MVDEDGEPLFDEEGRPLKEDRRYLKAVPNRKVVMPEGMKAPARLLWTEEDKLLLYREIQKCPIDAKSAYVSAVLHRLGDWDCTEGSDVFRIAGSMHLRDQMKGMVRLRSDRDLPVVGNARFYLPVHDPRKKEFDRERMGGRAAAAGVDPNEEQRLFIEAARKAAAEARKSNENGNTKVTRKKRKRPTTVEEEEKEEGEDAQNGRPDAAEEEAESDEGPARASRPTQQSQADEELDELEIEKEIGAEAADETASDVREEAGDRVADQPLQDAPAEEGTDEDAAQPEPKPAQKRQRVVSLGHLSCLWSSPLTDFRSMTSCEVGPKRRSD